MGGAITPLQLRDQRLGLNGMPLDHERIVKQNMELSFLAVNISDAGILCL